LFAASGHEECDVVKCLLSSGANINLSSKWGQSPLFIALMYGCCDIVKWLLGSGADINFSDNIGQ
jgi:ankyrin repeat protein